MSTQSFSLYESSIHLLHQGLVYHRYIAFNGYLVEKSQYQHSN